MESNVDPQLLLMVKFTPRLKLHEIHLQVFDDGNPPPSSPRSTEGLAFRGHSLAGLKGSAPKNVRLFVNEPNLSFEDVEDAKPAQAISFNEEDIADGVLRISLKLIKYVHPDRARPRGNRWRSDTCLRVGRFQKVDTVSLFVEDNLGGKERTRIRRIRFIGDAYEKVTIDLTQDE